MKIKVTQRHIDEGTQGTGDKCAVALALKERGYKLVSVYRLGVRADEDRMMTPKRMEAFIRRFDANKNLVKPTNFVLSPIQSRDLVRGYAHVSLKTKPHTS